MLPDLTPPGIALPAHCAYWELPPSGDKPARPTPQIGNIFAPGSRSGGGHSARRAGEFHRALRPSSGVNARTLQPACAEFTRRTRIEPMRRPHLVGGDLIGGAVCRHTSGSPGHARRSATFRRRTVDR